MHKKPLDKKLEAIAKDILKTYEESKRLKLDQKEAWILDQEQFLVGLEFFRERFGESFFRLKDLAEKELRRPSKSNPILKFNPPCNDKRITELGESRSKASLAEKVEHKYNMLSACMRDWTSFCEGWSIKGSWDGSRRSLSKHVHPSVRLAIIERATIGRKEIAITLNAWATKTEMDDLWPEVEKQRKQIYSGKIEAKDNPLRDQLWQKLRERGFKISQIAGFWIERYPEEIELMVLDRLKKSYKQEIESALNGKSLDNDIFLAEIKSGKWPKLKGYFEKEKKYYITGKIEWHDHLKETVSLKGEGERAEKEAKGTPPFEDRITKSIKRMKLVKEKTIKFPPEHTPFKFTYLN